MKLISITVIALFICASVNAQQKWSLRTNTGIASGRQAIDGYYFSFDVGMPINSFFEIAPTFSSASMLPSSNYYFWTKTFGYNEFSTPTDQNEVGESLHSVSLLLNFKPFAFFKGKWQKHELIIGTGISYNSYAVIKKAFDLTGNDFELNHISAEMNNKFEPYYCKINYNYLFRENLFTGLVAGINGFDSEAELLIGLQFGVKFN